MLLCACAGAPPAPPAAPSVPAPSLPAPSAAAADPFTALYEAPAKAGVLRIADDALIAITVRRGGALARLGHDHVVAARRIDGRVDPAAGLAVLRFRLDEMTVDEAALRQEAGLTTQPSADAIAGTRTNMLTKVLDAEHHPWVEVRVRRTADAGAAQAAPVQAAPAQAAPPQAAPVQAAPVQGAPLQGVPLQAAPLQVDITLHGVTRRYTVPTSVEAGAGGLAARGTLTLKQTDFGITPFSVMGGAMAVQDALEIRFVLPARPMAPDRVR